MKACYRNCVFGGRGVHSDYILANVCDTLRAIVTSSVNDDQKSMHKTKEQLLTCHGYFLSSASI